MCNAIVPRTIVGGDPIDVQPRKKLVAPETALADKLLTAFPIHSMQTAVCQFLTSYDLARLSCTCKVWKDVIDSPEVQSLKTMADARIRYFRSPYTYNSLDEFRNVIDRYGKRMDHLQGHQVDEDERGRRLHGKLKYWSYLFFKQFQKPIIKVPTAIACAGITGYIGLYAIACSVAFYGVPWQIGLPAWGLFNFISAHALGKANHILQPMANLQPLPVDFKPCPDCPPLSFWQNLTKLEAPFEPKFKNMISHYLPHCRKLRSVDTCIVPLPKLLEILPQNTSLSEITIRDDNGITNSQLCALLNQHPCFKTVNVIHCPNVTATYRNGLLTDAQVQIIR